MPIRDIDIRRSHPSLFRVICVIGLICVGLGLNFLLASPTFNPYGFPKEVTGGIFLALGISKLFTILALRNLRILRINMALCMGFMLFWGFGTSITYFTGQTSLQLFVLYWGLTAIQLIMMLEPVVNPLTAKPAKKP